MGVWSSLTGIFRRDARDSARNLKQLAEGPPITVEQLQTHMAGMSRKERRDAWQNILTAVGTARDKRESGEFLIDPVQYEEARDLWRGDDMAKRVIQWLPSAGMRRGFDVKLEEKAHAEATERALRKLKFGRTFVRAGWFQRAYGGAAIMPIINDSEGDLTNPLGEHFEMPKSLVLFEPRELRPVSYYEDADGDRHGEVEVWRTQPIVSRAGMRDAVEIHESRLIIFPGIRVSKEQPVGCFDGWGDNVLTVMRNVLRDYNLSWGAGVLLLQELSVGIFKMSRLGDLIESDKDDVVSRRMMQLDIGKSVVNSLVMDADDDYRRESVNLSGADALLGKFEVRLAAAADMTVTNLMGQSPAGMNATGESDITQDDDRVIAYQDEHMPQLERGVELVLMASDGPTKGKLPDNWSAEYRPLRQPTAKEEAERRYTVAQTDEIYYNMHATSSDEIADSRWGGDAYSADMHIDWEARAGMAELASAAETEMDPAAMAALGRDPAAAASPSPSAASAGAAGAPAQVVLNGAQIQAGLSLAIAAAAKQIPRDTAKGLMIAGLGFTDAQAEMIVPPDTFQPPAPAAPAAATAPPAEDAKSGAA